MSYLPCAKICGLYINNSFTKSEAIQEVTMRGLACPGRKCFGRQW
jgi:hypothetical protein